MDRGKHKPRRGELGRGGWGVSISQEGRGRGVGGSEGFLELTRKMKIPFHFCKVPLIELVQKQKIMFLNILIPCLIETYQIYRCQLVLKMLFLYSSCLKFCLLLTYLEHASTRDFNK